MNFRVPDWKPVRQYLVTDPLRAADRKLDLGHGAGMIYGETHSAFADRMRGQGEVEMEIKGGQHGLNGRKS
jgi:hypothetical protein